jgi:hypothetical protein
VIVPQEDVNAKETKHGKIANLAEERMLNERSVCRSRSAKKHNIVNLRYIICGRHYSLFAPSLPVQKRNYTGFSNKRLHELDHGSDAPNLNQQSTQHEFTKNTTGRQLVEPRTLT